ncbi:MAG: hypothetical protein HN867_12075 [Deltaproteobacteria bacterium]|nr:hypothetical protein [Deltaproteobacteria bacterium]
MVEFSIELRAVHIDCEQKIARDNRGRGGFELVRHVPLPMVAIEAAVNSCHDDSNLLPMHTLDRKGSQKEIT